MHPLADCSALPIIWSEFLMVYVVATARYCGCVIACLLRSPALFTLLQMRSQAIENKTDQNLRRHHCHDRRCFVSLYENTMSSPAAFFSRRLLCFLACRPSCAVLSQTVFILQIREAAAKTKDPLFTFGVGVDKRQCAFKSAFQKLMGDLQVRTRSYTV